MEDSLLTGVSLASPATALSLYVCPALEGAAGTSLAAPLFGLAEVLVPENTVATPAAMEPSMAAVSMPHWGGW